MSNAVIPKEQLSAYQRWEMASFGDDRPNTTVSISLPTVALPTNEEVAAIRESARQEGYAAGHAEGYDNGLSAAQHDIDRELAVVRQIAEVFGTEVAQADEKMAQDMLDLALDLAKAMLKTTLTVKPELILPVVTDAIHYLPAVQQPALLLLHPQDATLVREHIGAELTKAGWRVTEDIHIERGGCRVETASNQIDATAPTRWQRLTEALGKQSDWLAP